jgi:hypothetical protein
VNEFPPTDWSSHCSPETECIDLNPSHWSPVIGEPEASDSGAASNSSVAEAAFCGAPANRNYTFAFDASLGNYDLFWVTTGNDECSGRIIAVLGIGGENGQPLAQVRTHCFTVPGDLLGSRLAIVPTASDAVVTNLRAVSSCPCSYPIPYNVNTCPGVEGSAGHPNCG